MAMSLSGSAAYGVGMSSVGGTITCNFGQVVGLSATAKGDVKFQLNNKNQLSSILNINLGYSSTFAFWGWKTYGTAAGAFYAYGFGSIGDAKNAARYCQGLLS